MSNVNVETGGSEALKYLWYCVTAELKRAKSGSPDLSEVLQSFRTVRRKKKSFLSKVSMKGSVC